MNMDGVSRGQLERLSTELTHFIRALSHPDAMQWLMAGCGATCTAMVYFGLPETAHFTPHQQAKDKIQHETGRRPKFVWIPANPLKVFGLLLRPNICMMVWVSDPKRSSDQAFEVLLTWAVS